MEFRVTVGPGVPLDRSDPFMKGVMKPLATLLRVDPGVYVEPSPILRTGTDVFISIAFGSLTSVESGSD